MLEALEEYEEYEVVNFVTKSNVDRLIDGPEPFVQTNVVCTLRLLEAFKAYLIKSVKHSKESFRFLHVFTDEVYGSLKPEDPAFCKTTLYIPNSPYSTSKASTDHLVHAYHHTFGLPMLTTICSNNYDPFLVVKISQIFRVSGISLLVVIDDAIKLITFQEHTNEIRSNKTESTGYQNILHDQCVNSECRGIEGKSLVAKLERGKKTTKTVAKIILK